jgi:hypothetical protein
MQKISYEREGEEIRTHKKRRMGVLLPFDEKRLEVELLVWDSFLRSFRDSSWLQGEAEGRPWSPLVDLHHWHE